MRIELPLEVTGLMGPILCWVEGLEGLSMPPAWMEGHLKYQQREQAWLIRELPTYSFDTVDEVVRYARPRKKGDFVPVRSGRSVFGYPELSPPPGYDLAEVFGRLCRRYFVWTGGTVCVGEGRMEELHELSLRFPAGHLIRHDHAEAVNRGWITPERALDLPEQISLLPSNSYALRTVVRRGLSEGHLHLMGVTSAEESWADSLLKQLSSDALHGLHDTERRLILLSRYTGRLLALAVLCAELGDSGPTPPSHLLPMLDAVYFARNRLEDWTARRRLREEYRNLFYPPRDGEGTSRLRDGGSRRNRGGVETLLHHWLPDHLNWLLRWIDPGAHRLRRTYRSGGISLPELQDILVRTRLLERLHFAAHSNLSRLPEDDPRRFFLHEVLYRYLVFRTHHWQLATQYGKTTGLRYFKRFYDSRQRRPIGSEKAETKRLILRRLRRWRGLRVLEGRVGPPECGAEELKPWVVGYAEKAVEGRLRKLGLVVHFIKAEVGQFEQRATALGYPSLRYGGIRRVTRRKAFRLFRLLSEPSAVVPFIVGIDAANLELTTPPEVYAPAFRFLRDLPIEPRRPAHRSSDPHGTYPQIRELVQRRRLGMTYHVGEDFRHLLSGLRAIHEVMLFLRSQPGDRLGHGIALGLKPEVWVEQTGFQAVLSKQEWLDTLVWVHHLLGPGHDLVGEMALEDQIQKLAWEVYVPRRGRDRHEGASGPGNRYTGSTWAEDLSPLTLYDAWRLRQLDPWWLDIHRLQDGGFVPREIWTPSPVRRRWAKVQRAVQKEVDKEVGAPNAYRLLSLYWFDDGVRKRGSKLDLWDMQKDKERWIELCRQVQVKVQQEVRTRQLVVEVNPSVNRMIGPMERLEQHHAFNLTLDENKRLKRDIRVTVNTDNPAVFNTSLAHEYYLLGEILIRQGVPETEVVEWLEWLRSNGTEYSFVRQLPEADDPEMKKLLDAIRKTRPGVRSVRSKGEKMRIFWREQEHLLGGDRCREVRRCLEEAD